VKQLLVVGLLAVSAPTFAQAPAPDASEQQGQRRYQIRVLESVLVSAVQHAAETMGRRIQAVTPNVVLMADTARARGFVLPAYGVFFDVEVPGLPLSVAWTMRVMGRDFDVASSLELVRRYVESIPDVTARREAEQALERIELEVTPPQTSPSPPPARVPGATRTADTVQASSMPGASPVVGAAPPTRAVEPPQDPNEMYTTVVANALIDAMLDYSGPMGIGPDEWLTIAARDAQGPVYPGEAYDAMTIVLRIRGRDLADFRAERITRDEARKRVEVREF
jgi:hypothetical protein